MGNESNIISLNVSKDVITPIVERHIKDAVLTAMGGRDEVISKVLDGILTQRVNSDGKVGSYSSDNKYLWIDIVFTKKIEEAVRKELEDVMSESVLRIKKALILKLKTDKGASMVADALIEGLNDTFKNNYKSKVDIHLSRNE